MLNKLIEIHTIDNIKLTGYLRAIEIEADSTVTRSVEVTSEGKLKGETIDINEKEVYIIVNIG